ncbi:MAG TPA: hypothetical protein VFZ16_14570 [Hyphomicrobiaceae bacterium]|jgi:hypothetical protein|nr:hypothetical protein [Hyphomicrobiaceae bacterium]
MTAAVTTSGQPSAAVQTLKGIRIYEYTDLVYWWAIWFAALVCSLITAFGETIEIGGKGIKFSSSPWVGIGFLVVMFSTLIFTHLRARGLHAIILALAAIVVGLIVHMTLGWHIVFDQLTLLKVHMNLAYYVVTFIVTFVIWLYSTVVHARLSYGVVKPGEVGWRSPLTGQVETYKPLNFHVGKRSDDLIVHRILGLGFLGLGTGDIEVKFDVPGGGSQHHVFENVWRPDVKVAIMEKLITLD